jgi:hypothetical protein
LASAEVSWDSQRGQNGDNGNYDQQFNQRKSADTLTLFWEGKYGGGFIIFIGVC